ncbi:hypothetical protein BH09ACT10_BH09ACT10_02130 [soil metagenome]
MRLTVVAHFDPQGMLAPHVARQLAELAASSDKLVVTTTSALTDDARAQVLSLAELHERPNYGQDFYGWKEAIDRHFDADTYDELVLTNDTYVGPVRPFESITAEAAKTDFDVWGITDSLRREHHIQSYLLFFTPPALKSETFRVFWRDLKPAKDRNTAIATQEIGLSKALRNGGFKIGGIFTPTPKEVTVGQLRMRHWHKMRIDLWPEFFQAPPTKAGAGPNTGPETEPENKVTCYADAVLDHGRMPLVKFDVLRYDPYWLGSDALLTACEEAFPTHFEGVRDYLARTKPFYRRRVYENYGSHDLSFWARRRIGYAR